MPEFGTNRLMIAGRGMVLLMVLAGILLSGRGDEPDGTRVVVLVDKSDRLTPSSIAQARDELAADLEPFAEELEVSAFEFGNAGSAATALEALQEALWRLEPLYRSAIIVVSDGQWQADISALLQRTGEAGIPVFWLPPASGDTRSRIVSIDAPARARAGQRIQVTVAAEVRESGNYIVELYANDEPVGRRPLVGSERTTISLSAPASGAMRLDAELLDADTGLSLDRLRAGALVNVASTPQLLAITNGYSPIAASLVAGGWSVTQVSPKEFAGLDVPLSHYNALILDDVATTDMEAVAWDEITAAVRRDALGLLVLGGPNSFGLGAYRESVLEQVLPVISEPPKDESPASVIFLVDISGSMGRQPGGIEGLRTARDAVLFTAAALRPADRVGLIAFDVEARQLLAPRTRDDHAAAIRKVWPEQASGGTSIIPALNLARSALEQEHAEQKLLLLVTDGMLTSRDLEELQVRLRAEDLEFTAMIVSDGQSDAPLSRVELSDRATLLVVDDVLRLPVLMRDEVETLRAAVVTDRTIPVVLSVPPVAGLPADWPPLDSYLVTRARPEATVMLAGDHGEPLFTAWTAGGGRVVALTGGLNQWATDWLAWPRWPELAAGLVNYIAVTNSGSARPDIKREASNRLSIAVDTGDVQDMVDTLRARLVPPAGPPAEVSLVPEAPGRYRESVTVDQIGQYTLAWEDEAGIHRHSFVRRIERARALAEEPFARGYVNDALLEEWNENSAAKLVRPTSFKSILIAAALVLLLTIIAVERVPFSRFWSVRRIGEAGRSGLPKRN